MPESVTESVQRCSEVDTMPESVTDAEKFLAIKKLYLDYYNTNQDVSVFTDEFYFAVGELLNGKKREDLKLKYLQEEKKCKLLED
ncbi:MAG: hypothetical protein PHH85_02350 [Candidatus Methanoperedens sp.]|nr:hypothetical protein [Candidatus Methanoperedens sp.]